MAGLKYPVLVKVPFFNKCINSSFPLDVCTQGKPPGRSACPESKGQHGQGSRAQSSTLVSPAREGALCTAVTAGDTFAAATPLLPLQGSTWRSSEFQSTNTGILCS